LTPATDGRGAGIAVLAGRAIFFAVTLVAQTGFTGGIERARIAVVARLAVVPRRAQADHAVALRVYGALIAVVARQALHRLHVAAAIVAGAGTCTGVVIAARHAVAQRWTSLTCPSVASAGLGATVVVARFTVWGGLANAKGGRPWRVEANLTLPTLVIGVAWLIFHRLLHRCDSGLRLLLSRLLPFGSASDQQRDQHQPGGGAQ
jgi:hypothetical protein